MQHKEMPLNIPDSARRVIMVLFVIALIGIAAYAYKFLVMHDYRSELLWHASLMVFFGPWAFSLVFIPAYLRRFPSWVVRIYGEKYLQRLTEEAEQAWLWYGRDRKK